MTALAPSPQAILAQLIAQHTGLTTTPDMLQAVASGASGRTIMRANGVLGIYWTDARADNNSFLPAAHGLARYGIAVPPVLAEIHLPNHCGACVVEDLGTTDLLSLHEAPKDIRINAYKRTLDMLADFGKLQPDWPLQPAFDAAMYRWEQSYFAEHLLERHLGKSAADFLSTPALQDMANWLAEQPRVPVHRDFQSQNVMLTKDGTPHMIDFQGMRMGLAEYDLASLLCDPYMELPADEQQLLIAHWEQLTARPLQLDLYCACAMQRLMQALGAFANIGYNMGKDWYLDRIPAGLNALRHIARLTPSHSPAASVATCLLHHIA